MATVSVRIDEKMKKDVEKVLNEIGLNISSAISVYFAQIVKQQEIPFKLQAKKGTNPDDYYNEEWYKGPEAAELLDRLQNGTWKVHDLPNLEGGSADRI